MHFFYLFSCTRTCTLPLSLSHWHLLKAFNFSFLLLFFHRRMSSYSYTFRTLYVSYISICFGVLVHFSDISDSPFRRSLLRFPSLYTFLLDRELLILGSFSCLFVRSICFFVCAARCVPFRFYLPPRRLLRLLSLEFYKFANFELLLRRF